MKNTVPAPNPFITAWLVSDECKALMQSEILRALALWKVVAAAHERTGREVSSARVSVRIGGVRGDRFIGQLTVGGPTAPYTLSEEFGAFRTGRHHQAAAKDLNKVLNLMAAAT